ncbi:MAG: agmatinase [Desulfobacterales bacterium]|jgi:agmatinase
MINVSDNLKSGRVAVIGIPFDANSSFMQGAARAPAQIRKTMNSGASNLCSESGIDLAARSDFIDLGDMRVDGDSDAIETIEASVTELLNRDIRLVSLGGDHAITYPIIKAFHKRFGQLEIVQLDAHPDLYDTYEGNRFSHACPFARIMEERLASRLIQIGIRALNPHQQQQAERFGVEIITIPQYDNAARIQLTGPLYLSIDLDVLDPAFAPGVSHHEPGGLTTRQVIELIQQLQAPFVGADIVELNPKRDSSEITAMAAVKILKEVSARMLELPIDLK